MSGRNHKSRTDARLGALLLFALLLTRAAPAASLQDLKFETSKGQWNDAAETSYEILTAHPGAADANAVEARLQGAYALFQKGYSNAALLWLKPLKPKQWQSVPQGEDRFAEIISLFQKKVPLTLLPGSLDQVSLDDASPYLYDELRFAKGRRAFEEHDMKALHANLEAVSQGSMYYAEAHYLLAAAAVEQKDYKTATDEFNKIFQPEVLDQSTEFWQDLSAQLTSHWGANLRIALNAQSIHDSERVGELALLGLARVSYATGQYAQALTYYSRVSPQSPFYPRAAFERIWTLLALNRHDDAQKAAAALSLKDSAFESIEARTLRALILTDAGRTTEARAEIDSFMKSYHGAKAALQSYETTQVDRALPDFLRTDLKRDIRLQALQSYESSVTKEIASLRREDGRLFPVFGMLAGELEPLVTDAKGAVYKMIQDHVARREADLEYLYVQAKLITAEIYLQDRENLRMEYKNLQANAAKQAEHDRKLVDLLQHAIDTVDQVFPRVKRNRMRLEFRQSELLWDLSTARGIVAQTTHNKAEEAQAEQLRVRSLETAQDVLAKYPNFEKRPRAMFFVGYAQLELDRTSQGVKSLKQYVKAYPRDAHVPDAYRMLADLDFDRNRFASAESLYEKILDFPDSPIVGYALYKIGWCAYNLHDFAKALLGLEKAVRWASENSRSHQLLSLKHESRHDLISIYAEVGDSRKAYDYFNRFFPGDTAGWVSDLAAELDRIGQYDKSAGLYRTLIALQPGAMNNVAREAEIINGQYHLHNWDGVLSETRKLVSSYKAELLTPRRPGTPAATAEKIMRLCTLAELQEFAKDPHPENVPRVTAQDELYLSAFGAWPSSEEPLYEHAHFLLGQGKTAEAIREFRKHWKQFKATLKEPRREESLRNYIDALDKASDVAKYGAELQAETQEYAKDYPNAKYARAIQFLRSTVDFKQGDAEAGIQLSQALFDGNPTDDIGRRAFKNLRVVYYNLKDWKRTYQWADQELKKGGSGVKTYANELKTVRMESLFQWADHTKDDAASAKLFLQLARDPNMQPLRAKAFYDAFIRLHHAGHEVAALEVANELQKSSPDFSSLADLTGVRAALYQEAGDYAQAYPLLLQFVAHPGTVDPKVVRKAQLNLALIAEALGRRAEALKRYQKYVASAKDTGSASVKEAQRGMKRLTTGGRKPKPSWSHWAGLQKIATGFEFQPLPRAGNLPNRIKKGGKVLEWAAQKFSNASADKDTPAYFAFESYCTIPFLYDAYSKAVTRAGEAVPGLKRGDRQELRAELAKVTDPITRKVRSMAKECLSKSADSFHDGPEYRKVLERWGWRADAKQAALADQVLNLLKQGAPWFDAQKTKGSEAELLKLHLQQHGSADSWYALARDRWNQNANALSRLTLVDGLHLYPDSGELLNALATLSDDPDLYEAAGKKGSAAAWANLAYFHLRGGRLAPAEVALKEGLKQGSFDSVPKLKSLVQQWVKK